MNRALFLDRDGVINEDYGYVHKIEDFHFREGIFDVCREAMRNRYLLVVVTNQAGIGRGLYAARDFNEVTDHMLKRFKDESIVISAVYHCPHHPIHGLGHYQKNSFDRKPKPGMLIKAANSLDINLSQSIMIGDKISDKQAAYHSGIRCYIDAKSINWINSSIKILNI